MKKIILTLIAIIFSLLPAHAVKKIEANPINIAVMLTQETDTARITSTCEYYGYTRQTPKDAYTIFTHPNGSVIRYKFTNIDQKYPTIEVNSKASQKEKDKILKNLNFQKDGNTYVRKSVGYTTRCTTGPHSSLIIIRHSNPKTENQ